jgi:AcrR family transcriptional regulator
MPKAKAKEKARYHHGDLREALLREAGAMIREGGLEEFSLRKLAERIDVTAASLYHHFQDKNDLLCALAEQGFHELERASAEAKDPTPPDLEAAFRAFVRGYIRFATTRPERYDLMFGRTIWKAGTPTEALRTIAYAVFRRYVERVEALVKAVGRGRDVADPPKAGRANDIDPLRLAEASWAMLHGLCRLRIDGIYVDPGSVDAMSEEAARMVLARLGRGPGIVASERRLR